ncbi:MAG TPA: helix-turn-helix domain-containing protein [Candidatus Latescibacteria bacterium]|jgi:transcriptional regulator of acetoin/glycerol metabolism|nr:helix-turn-helix domain-containing protein [Candidatus Latescibacterota bacterium]HJP31859.1 helix-turn-helix domain-containing protein [Candidatus Latescibacterota bacterium]
MPLLQGAPSACDGNVSQAARLLGSNRNKIYRALGQLS